MDSIQNKNVAKNLQQAFLKINYIYVLYVGGIGWDKGRKTSRGNKYEDLIICGGEIEMKRVKD